MTEKLTYNDGEKTHVAVPSLEQEIRSLKRWLKLTAIAMSVMALVVAIIVYTIDRHNLWNQSLRGWELCRYAWDACKGCG